MSTTNAMLWTTVAVVALALLFEYSNGFQDASNVVAMIVYARVFQPRWALVVAALGEFVGAFGLGTAVAKTVGSGIISPSAIRNGKLGLLVIGVALVCAFAWNILAWRIGMPTSSSHALLGGLAGAGAVGLGPGMIHWATFGWVGLVLVTAPLLGLAGGYGLTRAALFFGRWLTRRASGVFKVVLGVTAVCLAIAHGANDAQKSMGIITFSLLVGGLRAASPGGGFEVPAWVIGVCAAAMAAGVASGSCLIVKTLGTKLHRVRMIHGFGAQVAAAIVIASASLGGFPVSTTQVVTGSIMGSGAADRPKAVHWDVAADISGTWLITIPVVAAGAAVTCALARVLISG